MRGRQVGLLPVRAFRRHGVSIDVAVTRYQAFERGQHALVVGRLVIVGAGGLGFAQRLAERLRPVAGAEQAVKAPPERTRVAACQASSNAATPSMPASGFNPSVSDESIAQATAR